LLGSSSHLFLSDSVYPIQHAHAGTRKIISFSLYGNDTLYTTGAIRNAEMIPALYQSWTARFYVDGSVPNSTIRRLRRLGAEVIHVKKEQTSWTDARRMWRYLALDDADAEYVMLRDCDSRITTREIMAVNTWLESGFRHHVMRDHPNHTDVIIGGMWSATAVYLRSRVNIAESISQIVRKEDTPFIEMEKNWLRTVIWPIIKHNALVHDAFNCELHIHDNAISLPFPSPREWHADYVARSVIERFDRESDYFKNGERELFGGITPENCRLSPEHLVG
jgi:hypothetical protein